MRRFLRNHFQGLLVVGALLLLGFTVFYVLWGIKILAGNITRALVAPTEQRTDLHFNLEEAKKLNLPLIRQ